MKSAATPNKKNQVMGSQSTSSLNNSMNVPPQQSSTDGKGKGKGKGKAMYFPNAQPDKNAAPMKMTSHAKAGLQFSVSRVVKYMKMGRYAERISAGAPVFMAAAL